MGDVHHMQYSVAPFLSRALLRGGVLLLLGAWFLGLGAPRAWAQPDEVEVDPDSGNFSRNLPFDVPFVIKGIAPTGTTGVELRYEENDREADSFTGDLLPSEALVSGVDGAGLFRIRMEAVDPNHRFRFHIAFERRLPGNSIGAFREQIDTVLRRELSRTTRGDITDAQLHALRQAILLALQRAMNEGQLIASPRVEVSVKAPGTVFDDDASPVEIRNELTRLTADIVTRQAERAEGLRLYQETTRSFSSELAGASSSPELKNLLLTLQKQPESDPRNPRNVLALSEEASRLVTLGDVEIEALARGLSLAETPVELAETLVPEDADAVRSHYLRTARVLRELRDWLESLVAQGGAHRSVVDGLLEAGELTTGQVDSLQRLADIERGPIRTAERWAETLEVYVYDVQRSLAARERALAEMVAGLEAQALDAAVRQSTVTEVVSSDANIYVGLDLGAAYPPELERAAFTIGANIYFRPVNKKAPLRLKGTWKHRLAMTVGITFTNLKLEDETRYENLLGDRSNLMVGMGYRLTHSIRIGGGAMFFLKNDPNPLVTERSLGATPYISLSFDVDLIGALTSH
jgi:hypothetical protein